MLIRRAIAIIISVLDDLRLPAILVIRESDDTCIVDSFVTVVVLRERDGR